MNQTTVLPADGFPADPAHLADPGSRVATTGPPAVQLSGVRKTFGDVVAVQGLDLCIAPGEVVAFLGPNGAGKTTTIDMVLGLARPTSGAVQVYGRSPNEAIGRGLVAAVMQTGGLLKDLSVCETLQLTAALFSRPRPVDEVMERAGITEIADRRVGKCSGGQQQRLRFAMALLPDPELLILDEPTTDMDVEGRREFWTAIRADAAEGRSVLFATHYLEEADAYADRIVLISRGRVVADGTASEVKAMASGRVVRATWPGADDPDVGALAAIPGVEAVEQRGDTVLIRSADTDEVALYLLTRTPARTMEITSRGLEDAFVALTSTTPDNTTDHDRAHDGATA